MKRRSVLISFVLALVLFGCGKDEVSRTEPGPDDPSVPDTPADPDDPDDMDDPDDVDWAAAVAYVFDASVIPELHISVTQAEWDRLVALYDADSNTQEYIHCDIRFVKGGKTTTVTDAGLRLKGNTSRRRPEHHDGRPRHIHFGLDFHHYHPDSDHTLKGLRKADLKWFKDDPAYVREVFCYDLFRRYGVWTGIRDVYARLWVRVGEKTESYYGVYGLMEHIDKNYVRVRVKDFGAKGGNLWKCRYGATLGDTNADIGVDDNRSNHTYELKTNKTEGFSAAKAQLQDFIRNVRDRSGSGFNAWLPTVMDVDLLLRSYAVNVAVGMWDDYWANSNNYYLYFNSTDAGAYKVFWIPYDYDNTLGTSSLMDSGRQDPYHWGRGDCLLMEKVMANSAWKAKYRGYLRELCLGSGLCAPSVAQQRIRTWQTSIASYVSNDTGDDMEIADRPASWGNRSEYRLLSGGSSANWFEVKSATVAAMQ